MIDYQKIITQSSKARKLNSRLENLPLAINVVPGVADQSDLVEDGGVDAEVTGLVSVEVTSMEDLALGINIGVEAGLVLGGTVELGLGDLGVGWVDSLTGSQ